MKYNIKACLQYNLGKRIVPADEKIWIDIQNLTPLSTSPFDTDNHQVFTSGPVRGTQGSYFQAERIKTYNEQLFHYNKYLEYCKVCNIKPRHDMWTYTSMACNSFDQFRIDIYKPGRCVVKCTLPQLGCASVWFYYSENKGDFGKIRPRIDTAPFAREVYFEIDIFETFREALGTRVAGSGHFGTQTDRHMKTAGILSRFSGFHYPEVLWDGEGNWTWKLDGVTINKAYIPVPEKVYPYLKLTYMVMDEFPSGKNFAEWIVNYVQLSDIIKL